MYKFLLIRRYLTRKLVPLFAALAVALCTAMVIIVISVMGGFLEMMRQSARKLTGDVTVTSGLGGFPHYQDLIQRLQKLPEVQATTPTITAYGLVNVGGIVHTVQVLGIDPPGLSAVVGYDQSLYWTQQRIEAEKGYWEDLAKTYGDPWPVRAYEKMRDTYKQFDLKQMAMTLQPTEAFARAAVVLDDGTPVTPKRSKPRRGIVLGIEIDPGNRRDEQQRYSLGESQTMRSEVTLTVLPVTQKAGLLEPAVEKLVVVNEFKSGLYDVDANRVFVPFDLLQQMMHMQQDKVYDRFDPRTGEPLGEAAVLPARATEVVVKAKPGISEEVLAQAVTAQVRQMLTEKPDLPPLYVQTWRQQHATLLGAVEKEKGLLTFLFAFISVVAVAMIAVIFYMIVLEKTRDIGTLRALGASRMGISSIFLGYGLSLGVLGSTIGLILAAAIVMNINEIQDKLNTWFHFQMWDKRVYYFDRIPSQLNLHEVAVITAVAIAASVVGALLPAYFASRVDPVESLRYE